MSKAFAEKMCSLRHERGLNQREAASELGISQALLSHYENNVREPGLDFVARFCDYYGVSADYLLGRCESPDGSAAMSRGVLELAEELRAISAKADAMAEEYAK